MRTNFLVNVAGGVVLGLLVGLTASNTPLGAQSAGCNTEGTGRDAGKSLSLTLFTIRTCRRPNWSKGRTRV